MTLQISPKKIRGRPFQPGNPGRPPGAKNKTTRLVEQLLSDEAENLTRKLIELAKNGNVGCLRDCIERIVAAMAAITTAVNNGSLSPEEAGSLVRVLEGHAKAIETYDLAVRLDRLEAQLKGSS